MPIYVNGAGQSWSPMNASYAEILEEDVLRLSETGQALVHGRKEIAQRLLAVRDRGGQFTRVPGQGGKQRRFRLLQADCEANLLLFAVDSVVAADLAEAHDAWITLSYGCPSGRAEFVIAGTEAIELRDGHAIRAAFPDALLLYQDRTIERVAVVSDVWLEWELGARGTTFRARLLDVGLGGAGALLLEPGLCLEPGARLKARVVRNGQRSGAADLEVRFSTPVLLGDGCSAVRLGFQFLEAPSGLESLLALL